MERDIIVNRKSQKYVNHLTEFEKVHSLSCQSKISTKQNN